MTEERIDIEITDKINPKVSEKIRAIASAARDAEGAIGELKRQLATIDVSAVEKLANSSAKVAGAQARQVSAQARLNNSNARLEITSVKAAIAQQKLGAETARTDAATARAAQAATRAATATVQQEIAVSRLAQAKAREAAATDAATAAQRINNRIRQAGNSQSRQSIQQTQNLVYQLNDIVVGLASGQKPMTVLLQQGSQISTIYGPGRGVLGTFRALGASLATIFVPLLPVIAVVGTLAAGFAVLTHEIQKTTKTNVTFGDTFKAVFQVAASAISDILGPSVKKITPYFEAAYKAVLDRTTTLINNIIGSFVFAYNAIKLTFNKLPAALKDIFVIAANSVITVVENLVNAVVKKLNVVTKLANDASKFVGLGEVFGSVADVDLSQYKGKVTGAAQEFAGTFKDEFTKAFNADYTGQAFDAISAQAIKNAKARIAKEGEAKGGSGGKKETFADIRTKLQNDIAELQAVGAARRELTIILDAQEKLHRKLTDTERAELAELSKQLDVAKIRSDLLENTTKSLEDYNNTVAAGTQLLRENLITQEQYNTALSKTQLATDLRSVDSTLPQYQDQAAIEELQVAQQERISIVQQAMEARIITEQEGADRIRAINQQLDMDIRGIEAARNSVILQGASETFDSLAQAAAGFAGEQSGLYKTLFAVSKAFAIADSIMKIQQGIANALALPFPANLAAVGTVAAAAANIVSSIQAVQFAAGKKDGGFISGPGGPRDDRVPIMASNGEFVVNSKATKRNRPLLEAINSNGTRPYRDGGLVGTPRQTQSPSAGKVGGKDSGGSNQRGSVTVNVYAQDAASFMASKNQVAAAMARTVNDGYRNL